MTRSGSRLLPRTAAGSVVYLVVGLALCLVVVGLTGCSRVRDQRDGAERTGAPAPPTAPLETVEWAELDGLVSVLVRNTADRLLRQARATVTVVERDEVVTTVEGPCCRVVDVPPGAVYAFSFHLPADAGVDDVQVAYRDLVWSGAAADGGPSLVAAPHHVYVDPAGSVVVADVTTDGAPVDAAVVQAVVDDADGDLVAIVSGTWTCFTPGRPRRIWMQLYTRLPAGSTVRTVTAFARPSEQAGGDANRQTTCVAPSGPRQPG